MGDFQSIGESVAVSVRLEGVGLMGVHLGAVIQAVLIGIRLQRMGLMGVHLGAITQPVTVGVRFLRIRPQGKFLEIGQAILVRIFRGVVGADVKPIETLPFVVHSVVVGIGGRRTHAKFEHADEPAAGCAPIGADEADAGNSHGRGFQGKGGTDGGGIGESASADVMADEFVEIIRGMRNGRPSDAAVIGDLDRGFGQVSGGQGAAGSRVDAIDAEPTAIEERRKDKFDASDRLASR